MDLPSSLVGDSADYPEVAQAFHIANFVPVNWGAQDLISRSVVDFQFNREPQTSRWIRLALVAAANLSGTDVIVRALSSKELLASGKTPLDRVGQELAQRMGSEYAPQRLTKLHPTAAVKNAGNRESREKILWDAYMFEAEGLPASVRIMIIDDIVTTGATFAAIASAIRVKLPEAVITYFALARTDPWLVRVHLNQSIPGDDTPEVFHPNADLDERYFYGSSVTAERRRQPGTVRSVQPRPIAGYSAAENAATAEKVFGDEEAAAGSPPEVQPEPPISRPQVPSTMPRPARAVPASGTAVKTALVGIAALVLISAGYFALQGGKEGHSIGESPLPPPHETFSPSRIEPETSKPKPRLARPDTRLRGVINVPLVGLRTEPSITSTSVPDVIVQKGERVIVVRVIKPEFGLQWALIETASRKQGWVIAPVITFDTPDRLPQ